MALSGKIRLGDLLLQQGLITSDQLAFALEQQMHVSLRLGRILVNNGFVTEEHISEALAKQFDIPYINLKHFHFKPELTRLLSESHARRYQAIVLEERDGRILVGMANPSDVKSSNEIARILDREIDVAVVTEGELLEGIDRSYSRSTGILGSN